MTRKVAVIAGAGPAGLTAALELLRRTDITPVVFEMSQEIGGISRTVNYKGNRIDIGGHRFFSKSERVMTWWKNVLPLQGKPARDDTLLGRDLALSADENAPDPEETDAVMLLRRRISRIFFLRSFFDYPLSLRWQTVKSLGFIRLARIGMSYARVQLLPLRTIDSLEDFLVSRFGRELYRTFFRDYTEKVWGVSCRDIKPDWGAQRIKGLSVGKTIAHALRRLWARDSSLEQKQTETSLIEQFMYPKLGPGQLWEEVARSVERQGGEILLGRRVVEVAWEEGRVTAVTVEETATGGRTTIPCDYFFSTMPVRELVAAMIPPPPAEVAEVAQGLQYRDFITVGLLVRKLKLPNESGIPAVNGLVPDNWIYIQEREVKLGRLQIFNNWSPYLVRDPDTVWLGLEYFCNEGDDLWRKTDAELIRFAVEELAQIGIIEERDALDATILRVPKTYPAYFGSYDRFEVIREFTGTIENLFLVGRNGMHRYNNADHSMLTAMTAVDNIVAGVADKDNLWAINTEEEYHEQQSAEADRQEDQSGPGRERELLEEAGSAPGSGASPPG